MEKLRITHLITQLELGGAQRNTLYTVAHFNRARYDRELLAGPGGILDDEARQGDFRLTWIPTLVRPVNPVKDLRALIALYQHFRRTKPHVLHTHSSKAGILGRLAGYVAGIPVIVHTFHGFGFTPDQKPMTFKLFVALEKFCALLSTHLIFVSQDNKEEAAHLQIGTRTENSLIRSGIAISKTGEGRSLRSELGLDPNAFVVLSVGNFKPQKNPLDLVKVAAAVLTQKADLHFVFAGDGPLKAEAEANAQELGLTQQIHFLGWRQDIPDLLKSANVFLLTSLWEGLPRAIVEAFAARLPVVAYGVNGVKDIVEDGQNGFLIEPRDTARAAEKILWLAGHPSEASAMGHKGRATVETEFDIDRMVHQQEELYQRLHEAVPLKEYYQPRWTPVDPK